LLFVTAETRALYLVDDFSLDGRALPLCLAVGTEAAARKMLLGF
jgi:hypothetical protein